jgi:hypothetical protein
MVCCLDQRGSSIAFYADSGSRASVWGVVAAVMPMQQFSWPRATTPCCCDASRNVPNFALSTLSKLHDGCWLIAHAYQRGRPWTRTPWCMVCTGLRGGRYNDLDYNKDALIMCKLSSNEIWAHQVRQFVIGEPWMCVMRGSAFPPNL